MTVADIMSRSPDAAAETVRVDLGARAYDIRIGPGVSLELPARLKTLSRQTRVAIVSDEAVAARHLGPLSGALGAAGYEPVPILVPPGETSKRFGVLEDVLDRLLDARVERRDLVVALGGGVVGDLTGFAASILRRGVRFVQVPTTLLAQVDSSVGGKTGINTRHGKNLVGTFHQPSLVLADTGHLATLPDREMRAGYAEVVKYGLIGDAPFFAWLEENGARVLARETGPLVHAVATSCRAKAATVAADETEQGARARLNLGHTFGHALEAETGYSARLLHGEAVAIGMVLAFDLSADLGLAPRADAGRVRAHLKAAGLPVSIADIPGEPLAVERLVHHMKQDKKVVGGTLTLILAHGIGRAFTTQDVETGAIAARLAADGAGAG